MYQQDYQLYLSGIETGLVVGLWQVEYHYQLYLSGIETTITTAGTYTATPINCTYLELKLTCPDRPCSHSRLSIVPIWNWNASPYDLDPKAYELSIVPIWNWNLSQVLSLDSHSYYQLYLSGIETRFFLTGQYSFVFLSIVPIWNWNVQNWRKLSKVF